MSASETIGYLVAAGLMFLLVLLLVIAGKELVTNGFDDVHLINLEQQKIQEYNSIRDGMNDSLNQNDTFQERIFMLKTYCYYSNISEYSCVKNLLPEYLP